MQITNKCTSILMTYFMNNALTNMFWLAFRLSSGWCYCLVTRIQTPNLVCVVTQFNQICYVCILVIISPWRWPECRPKHVRENVVNKAYYKYCSAFVDYLYILDNFDNLGGTRYFLLISVHNNHLVIFSAQHQKYIYFFQNNK